VYDFPSDAKAKAIPYGVYDEDKRHGWVTLGLSKATPQFAVNAIRRWWEAIGKVQYAHSTHLMIEADSGGCNGHRPRLWKYALQQWANEIGLVITVCHYPTGASKWNPIEHQLFSQISRNWVGTPLKTLDTMLAFIRGTITTKGLKVEAGLMKIGGLRTFFLPVNLRVFVPFWVLGKDRSVLLACFLHAILGYPLIPLIKTVHSHGRRSALYQPTP